MDAEIPQNSSQFLSKSFPQIVIGKRMDSCPKLLQINFQFDKWTVNAGKRWEILRKNLDPCIKKKNVGQSWSICRTWRKQRRLSIWKPKRSCPNDEQSAILAEFQSKYVLHCEPQPSCLLCFLSMSYRISSRIIQIHSNPQYIYKMHNRSIWLFSSPFSWRSYCDR